MSKKFLSAAAAAAVMLSSVQLHASAAAATTATAGFENGNASLSAELIARYDSNAVSADGGSMEIVAYNRANGYAYAVSGIKGAIAVIDISSAAIGSSVTELSGTEYDVKKLVSEAENLGDFVYGDITSVAVSPDGKKLAACIQHKDYDKNGAVAVFAFGKNGTLVDPVLYSVGVQPDMVAFADNSTILTANEGEPRNGYAEGSVDPEGTVSIIDIATGKVINAGFGKFTAEELAKKNIIAGKANGKTLDPKTDLEPEYIAVSSDGKSAFVSLQEANAIAKLDIENGEFRYISSAGYQDYGTVSVDLVEDGAYSAKTYENLVGARMPDAISIYEAGGKTYILAANEGDAREWGDYCNEIKTKDFTGDNIRIIDPECAEGLPNGKTTMFGGRSFTIFEASENGLTEVFDSGNDFERLTAQYLPEYFNCSNDDIEADSRSPKKGPEAESITVGNINGRQYAFAALERIGGIMIYDITDPTSAKFVNYINSRDFGKEIAGDVSPEGLCFVEADGNNGARLIAACEVSGTVAVYELSANTESKGVAVLHINDAHCGINADDETFGYADIAAYEAKLKSEGYTTILVDAGDYVQGDVIGTLSKGEYIIDIMNELDFDIATLGNHEFDYGMEQFEMLTDKAEFDILSSNFIDLETNEPVFNGWKIVEADGVKLGFVGITTPETVVKSDPTNFKDENGEFIYSFCAGDNGEELYENVQNSVDEARNAGAEMIIAVGHLGIDEQSKPWTSREVIANTTGIDIFIDGHSHSLIESETVLDENGGEVVLTSSGTKLQSIGAVIISDGEITSELIAKGDYTVSDDAASAENNAYRSASEFIGGIEQQYEALVNTVVASTDVDLTIMNPENPVERIIRNRETNLGDLCADAYRVLMGADIAFVNGGGIRANIENGDITYGEIIAVHPFGNSACLIEATGREILDALELGACSNPEESGGFLQVSGITYEIHTYIPSSVVLTENKEFVEVSGEYRVKNVRVNGEPLDLDKTYTLASHNYMLKSGGDGYTMFTDNNILKDEVLIDNQVLINFIVDELGGVVGEEYADPYGDGRITVIYDGENAADNSEKGNPPTGAADVNIALIAAVSALGVMILSRRKR